MLALLVERVFTKSYANELTFSQISEMSEGTYTK